MLKDEARGKPPKTFRESPARHSYYAAFISCHFKIDPLGFGLEKLRWREGNAATLSSMGCVLAIISAKSFVYQA